MSRLIFLIVIVSVVCLLFKSRTKKMPPQSSSHDENMLRCVHCGLYVPEAESIRKGAQVFCCTAHCDDHQKSRAS